jgi:hypothetical protein
LRHVSAARIASATLVVLGASVIGSFAPSASASSGRGTVAASRTGKTVVVTWRAPHGADLLGFDVYRADGSQRVRINTRVIADTSLFGGSYRFVDANAPVKATRYWVQAVRLEGGRTWLGSVAAEHAIP